MERPAITLLSYLHTRLAVASPECLLLCAMCTSLGGRQEGGRPASSCIECMTFLARALCSNEL